MKRIGHMQETDATPLSEELKRNKGMPMDREQIPDTLSKFSACKNFSSALTTCVYDDIPPAWANIVCDAEMFLPKLTTVASQQSLMPFLLALARALWKLSW